MNPRWLQKWQSLAPRERRMLSVAAWVLGLGFLYGVAFDPAWQGRQKLQKELPPLRSQLGQVQANLSEYKRLKAQTASTPPVSDLKGALEAGLTASGLRSAVKGMNPVGDRMEVKFDDVDFQRLSPFLDAIQTEQRLRLTSVRLQRVAPGRVAAHILVGA